MSRYDNHRDRNSLHYESVPDTKVFASVTIIYFIFIFVFLHEIYFFNSVGADSDTIFFILLGFLVGYSWNHREKSSKWRKRILLAQVFENQTNGNKNQIETDRARLMSLGYLNRNIHFYAKVVASILALISLHFLLEGCNNFFRSFDSPLVLTLIIISFVIGICILIYKFLKHYFQKLFQRFEPLRIDDSYVKIFKEVENEMCEYSIKFEKL